MPRKVSKKRAEEQAKRAARAAALSADFKRRCKDPSDPLYDDPIWNPRHRLYPLVNSLINDERMTGGEAEGRARWTEVADIIADGVEDGSLPPGS